MATAKTLGKLRRIVQNAKGDDLERARREFEGLDPKMLWGTSGKTVGQVLSEYEADRAEWQAVAEAVDHLIAHGL